MTGKPTNPMTKDFDVYYIPDSPIVTIVAKRPYASGSITVLLKGLSVPISVEVTSGDTDSQSRCGPSITVWICDPAAGTVRPPDGRAGIENRPLRQHASGLPGWYAREAAPPESDRQVPDTTVWQLGDDLFIRTRAEIVDEFDRRRCPPLTGCTSLSSLVTPYVTFSVMGRSRRTEHYSGVKHGQRK